MVLVEGKAPGALSVKQAAQGKKVPERCSPELRKSAERQMHALSVLPATEALLRHTAFGLLQDRPCRPFALQSPAGQRLICASVYLLVFIRNLLVHLAEKILLMQPLTSLGDYPFSRLTELPVNT